MSRPPQNRRDSLWQGYVWATRATSIALQAVVPAGVGFVLDRWWGTSPWLVIVGTVIGFVGMLSELMAFTAPKKQRPTSSARTDRPDSPDHPKT